MNSNWRQYAKVSDQRFAQALDRMLQYDREERPQSAQEVLDTLSPEQQPNVLHSFLDWCKRIPNVLYSFLDWCKRIPRQWRRWISLGFLALLAVAIAVILYLLFDSPTEKTDPSRGKGQIQPPSTKPELRSANDFSRGENALIGQEPKTSDIQECTEAYRLKQRGIDAFKQASSSASPDGFQEAEKYFKQALDKFQIAFRNSPIDQKCEVDPETSIYYYNSKAAQTTSARSLPTIAVVIPSGSKERGVAQEILRGVAHVQKEQTEGNANTPFLQILLAKGSSNKLKEVRQVATHITQNNIPGDLSYFRKSKTLGVIGRYTSKYIQNIGEIYGSKQLVLIAPTSTAIRKPSIDIDDRPPLNPYVFRTAPDFGLLDTL